ncbi:MAG: response regulator [Planctomycetota bacterium]
MSRNAIHVLLVDDEPLVLSSLRRLLKRESFLVTTCTSGPEALKILESEEIDLIISDYKMPGMNGIDFLRDVRPRWPDIPRCMLTAQADQALLDASLKDGLLHRAFTKPWDSKEFVSGLRELVKN